MAVGFLAIIFVFLGFLVGRRRLLKFLKYSESETPSLTQLRIPVSDSESVAAEAEDSSSRSRSRWDYDVFLSFRGPDVRRGFISHLCEALENEGIKTFHDDNELKRGDEISEGLEKGIDQSRFAIIVISENYAISRWCLIELSIMIDLAEKKRLELIPIFYDIDPSDLKRRSGCFYEDLETHRQSKRYDLETLARWRRALAEVGNISGWDSKRRKHDSELIQEVVQDLSERFYSESFGGTTGLVGMSYHKKIIESFLSMDSEDVRMIGIWGMGGRGKTTIAKYIFEGFSCQFDAHCLLENVKGDFKPSDELYLPKKIMSKIFPKSPLNARCISSDAMMRRLRGKKVLLVLDDVDDVQQLQILAGSCEWFGPGSRIIITTRDKRVLDEHDVEYIYEVKPLRNTQALQLFSKHAFKMDLPNEEFKELSLNIVEQLGGLPLALRVIGASLYRREIAFWEDKLLILKNRRDKSISLALKASYDALDEQEQIVFLYVAGFFIGEYRDRARKILDPLVISSGPNLETLMEKSLISMTTNTRLWVHDLLQDMANTCEGKKEKSWKRKMLSKFLDIKGLFSENMQGTKDIEVESILLNMAEETELCMNPATFKMMFNLKFLKIHNNLTVGGSKVFMLDDLDYLPPLRYLHWEAYTKKWLPSFFQTDYLVELNLPDSSIETLWSGTQDLQCLKHMNLNRCRNLIELPDLSKARILESLCLCECEGLVELPPSLGHLDKLTKLSMIKCTKLKSLPCIINLNSLKILDLDDCTGIKDFPLVSNSIEVLGLKGTSIEVVPTSIDGLSKLSDLRLSQCKRMNNLPDTIGSLKSLRTLWVSNCPNVTVFPELGDGIEKLTLIGTAIEEVPSTIGDEPNLVFLDMSECKRLKNLPHTLSNLKKLKLLYLRGCTNITERPQVAGEMKKLDLYGTSIEEYGVLSEEEALELRNRDMNKTKAFLTRYVRNYKKKRNSR